MTMRTTQDAINGPDITEVLMTLGSFLAWSAEDGAYYGGHSGEDALVALQQLLGWDDERMTKFVEVFVEAGYE